MNEEIKAEKWNEKGDQLSQHISVKRQVDNDVQVYNKLEIINYCYTYCR